MLVANRLAIEALPLLPTIPNGGVLRTTGFASPKDERTSWTRPLWSGPLPLDVVRSALALSGPQQGQEDLTRSELGIVEVYWVRRLTIGKFRAFPPAQPTRFPSRRGRD